VNEDSHSALETGSPLFVVADGVGGGARASLASRELVEHLHAALDGTRPDTDAVRSALLDADRAIGRSIASHGTATGAATVALCAALGASLSRWLVAWVGDCRVYRLPRRTTGRRSSSRATTRIVTCAKRPRPGLAGRSARMIGNGAVDAPNVRGVDLFAGEMLVLCSDGVHRHASPEEIARVLREKAPLARRCVRLIELARVHGSRDDATVLVVQRMQGSLARRARLAVLAVALALAAGAGLWLATGPSFAQHVLPSLMSWQTGWNDEVRRDGARIRPWTGQDGDRRARRGVSRGGWRRRAAALYQALPGDERRRLRVVDGARVADPRAPDRPRHPLRARRGAIRRRRRRRHAPGADIRRGRDRRPVGDPAARGSRRRHAAHVFEDCAHWWALAHHCLLALDEIHALQLVHLDVKADNICIPYDPPSFDAASDESLHVAFDRLALIDFAFSLVSREKLARALPIGWQKDYDYQSPRLLRALEAGRDGDLRPTQELDWRCDLYSLAAMLRRYLPNDAWARTVGVQDGWTAERYDAARALVYRLRDCHDRELPAIRPHAELVEATSAQLRAHDLARSLSEGWSLVRDAELDAAETLLTPLTRIALARAPVTLPTAIAHAPAGIATPIADVPASEIVIAPGVRITPVIGPAAWSPAVRRNPREGVPAVATLASPLRARETAQPHDATNTLLPPRPAQKARAGKLVAVAGLAAAAAIATPSFLADQRPSVEVQRAQVSAAAPAGDAAAAPDVAQGAAERAQGAAERVAPSAPQLRSEAPAAPAATPAAVPVSPAAVPAPAASAIQAVPQKPARVDPPSAGARGTSARYPIERVAAAPERPGRPPATSEPRRAHDAPAAGSAKARAPASAPRPVIASTPSKAAPHIAAPDRAPAIAAASERPAVLDTAPVTERAPVAAPDTAVVASAAQPVTAPSPPNAPRAKDGSADSTPATVPQPAARGTTSAVQSAPRADRNERREPWRTALRDVLKLFGPIVQHAAPVEERSAQPARVPRPPVRTPAQDTRPSPAPVEPVEGTRVAAAPAASPGTTPMPQPTIEPVPQLALANHARIDAPVAPDARAWPRIDAAAPPDTRMPPRSDSAFATDPRVATQDDLREQARHLLADAVPRVASQAGADAYPILWSAAMADSGAQERAVMEATYTPWRSERAYAPAPAVEGRARLLHEQARAAYASGRDTQAYELALRGFAANPRDPDLAGLLAYLHLKLRPEQAETARQLALHALAFSGTRRGARLDDWATLAIASALAGRDVDATRAFMVGLALSDDAERSCRVALQAYAEYGARLRVPVENLLRRVHAQGRDYGAPACARGAARTLARAP
jgi:serine/threonine protein phosphatase PrpC